MFLLLVLLWAVISGGFIIWTVAGFWGCAYLKSYFQYTLSHWLMLKLMNNISLGFLWESKGQKWLLVCSLLLFICKSLLCSPQKMYVCGHNYGLPEIHETLSHNRFPFLSDIWKPLGRMHVDLESLLRESILKCVTSERGVIIKI